MSFYSGWTQKQDWSPEHINCNQGSRHHNKILVISHYDKHDNVYDGTNLGKSFYVWQALMFLWITLCSLTRGCIIRDKNGPVYGGTNFSHLHTLVRAKHTVWDDWSFNSWQLKNMSLIMFHHLLFLNSFWTWGRIWTKNLLPRSLLRFEVFMLVSIKVTVFWDIILRSVVDSHKHFRGTSCLQLQAPQKHECAYQALWHHTSEDIIFTNSSFLFHEMLLSTTIRKL